MKKVLSLTLILVLVLSLVIPVMSYGVEGLSLSVDNQRASWEGSVKMYNGIVMLPIYDFAKTIGGNTSFDLSKLKETFNYNGNEIVFRLDSNVAVLNGRNVLMSAPLKIIDNRLVVPVDFFTKNLNFYLLVQNSKYMIFTITNNTIAYKVVSGDTLWKLSVAFGTTMSDIMISNNLTSSSLYIGQALLIKKVYNNNPIDAYAAANATLKSYASWSATDLGYITSGSSISVLGKSAYWYKVNTPKGQGYMYYTAVGINQAITDINPDSSYFNSNIPVDTSKDTLSYIDYTVVSGDNSWSVAEKFGLPSQEFLNANGFTTSTVLKIGQVVKVPVHNIAVKTASDNNPELLDWFTEAQYVFPIGKIATVTDIQTGISFNVKRTIGSGHSDTETLTTDDTQKMQQIFGGTTWNKRPFILSVDGRRIAISIAGMPHGGVDGVPFLQNVANRSDNYGYGPNYDAISGNGMDGHFDLYFLNGLRHVDNKLDSSHQKTVSIAAGLR